MLHKHTALLGLQYLIIILCLIIFVVKLFIILQAHIPLSYDAARDLLLARDNLHTITLIGPTTGIPGIFYGPYWVWMQSAAMLISHHPSIILIITIIIPYIFGLLGLYVFNTSHAILSQRAFFLILIIFWLYSIKSYTVLWNPHLAPLALMWLVLLLTQFYKKTMFACGAGMLLGFIITIHFSLGLGLCLGTIVYICLGLFSRNNTVNTKIRAITAFIGGIVFMFLPFIIFEFRHGFIQTHTLFNSLASFGAGVTGIKGLSHGQILMQIPAKIELLFQLPWYIPIFGGAVAYFFSQKRSSKKLNTLLLLLATLLVSILGLYINAKNPVWEYHFIGVEVLLLLFMAVLIEYTHKFMALYYALVLVYASVFLIGLLQDALSPRFHTNDLASRISLLSTIETETGGKDASIYTYDQSIYAYDTAYISWWRFNKNIPYDPNTIPLSDEAYIIVPRTMSEEDKKNYIDYRTPDAFYETTNVFDFSDNAFIAYQRQKRH